MYKIGIDLGYGEVKAVNQQGKSMIFPSIVGLGHDRQSEILAQNTKGLDALHVRLGDEEFFVGELARRESLAGASITLEANKIHLPETRVLLATAAALLAPADMSAIHLATGLPLEEYSAQKNDFYRYLKNFWATVHFLGGPMEGESKTIRFADVTIIPQGLSAMQLAIYDGTRPRFDDVTQTGNLFALIDVGFRTTDFAVVEIGSNKRPLLRRDLCGTVNVGVASTYRPLQQAFNKITGSVLEERNIPHILSEGTIFHRGQEIDLQEDIQKNTVASGAGDSQPRVVGLAVGGRSYPAAFLSRRRWESDGRSSGQFASHDHADEGCADGQCPRILGCGQDQGAGPVPSGTGNRFVMGDGQVYDQCTR